MNRNYPPLHNRKNAEDWEIELQLMDRFSMRRAALSKSYRRKGGMLRVNPYTQGSLASRMGVNKNTLQHWECGQTHPRNLAKWVRWAQALDMDFVKILSEVLDGKTIEERGNYLGIEVDTVRRVVMRNERSIYLAPIQMKLFLLLLKGRGRTVPREVMFNAMYLDDAMLSANEIPDEKTLDVHKTLLNRRIRKLGVEIRNEWAAGFFLNIARNTIVPRMAEAAD